MQRLRDGELPGALVVDRNVLEWRLDPTSPHRLAVSRTTPTGTSCWSATRATARASRPITLQQLGLPSGDRPGRWLHRVGGYVAEVQADEIATAGRSRRLGWLAEAVLVW